MTDRPPPLRLLLAEGRVLSDWLRARTRPSVMERELVGGNAPVMTLPGFCAGDLSMAQMRRNLRAAGFRARGWGMGANTGAKADTLERIHARVSDIAEREGRAVHLVGWSLGGVMAREYAKHHPDTVASVVTMGSPFSGSRRANHAWRLYRIIAGHSVDNPPITFSDKPRPQVPTFALWSARDGVVAPACAHGQPHESDRAVELACGHMGFAYAQESIDAVIDCLVEAEAAVPTR
ncbi:alpha/beta fold hydrolase [Sphingomonas lacunae]|uniref:Alpha/beta fold hydrolase n=1 Tax=Sphingomonas lacunae TaxID=2698828 RepID=A0A6M4AQ32_9SPHN|nr:alpha/beta fold hydrolase [Sphingomonas lacunae]QJQ31135.1 alpha/beta fold hydrolase [Sphingomonas lacunae]